MGVELAVKMREKESLECRRMHIGALKTQKLPGPLSGPWTPAIKGSLHQQLSALEAGPPLDQILDPHLTHRTIISLRCPTSRSTFMETVELGTDTAADPGFLKGGFQPKKGGVNLFLAKICRKLHENKENWTGGRVQNCTM